MARPHPALTALVLLAVTLTAPAEADRTSDIIGAVKGQAAKVQGAIDLIVKGATQAAHPLAGGAGLGVKGPPVKHHRYSKRCGTHAPTAKQLAAVQPALDAAVKFADAEDAARNGTGNATRLLANEWGPQVKTVKVYWHVLREGEAWSQGNIPRDAINKQVAVLNQKFAPADIQFDVRHVDWTTNADWFRVQQGSSTEQDMKAALHQGSMKDLNVYSAAPLGTGGEAIAGFTKLPMFAKDDPQLDGSTILFDTLPGGSQYGMNLGMTLVHEAGHWLGLLHTFDGGCDVAEGGDKIGDTPYSAEASYDCTPKNTCPHVWGQDPIQNPMNYSPDQCMTKFTKMQYKRMRQNWYAFRSHKFTT